MGHAADARRSDRGLHPGVDDLCLRLLYFKYQHVVDDRLNGPIFAKIAQVYAAPREVRPGRSSPPPDRCPAPPRRIHDGGAALGLPRTARAAEIAVHPGPQSFHSQDGAMIRVSGGVVQSIADDHGETLSSYELEPQLITGLSDDANRTKRRLLTYNEIPQTVISAVLAIEDRRFFEHGGINYFSMISWGWHDLIGDRKHRGGASTLTMQLAKLLLVADTHTIQYKISQIVVALQLEHRFNKQQIFEMYANQVPLGQRGSFAINGFGEAAQAYFGKDLHQLDLAECALLAGIIQRPSYFNPYRHPDRAMERRNVVLDSMVETDAITSSEAERAKAEPLHLAPPNVDASEAPYFVDLVHDQIVQRLGDSDTSHSALRIYTSLDPDLQRAAAEAVDVGMKHVDDLVRAQHKKGDANITYPQVALVALNPHTGQILALVGGRNYTLSQLNHAVAERPTGSIFKPFVYATAYNSSLDGTTLDGGGVFTALTRINDDPQDFGTNGQSYIPGNFKKGEFPGMVTAADAIAHSLNIATIALAQQVGYDNVASLARSAGIVNARGTPSMAIGTYSATPIDMAGAYTVFANNGVHLTPWLLASVRNPNGDIVADFAPQAAQVLDPRVAFLTQSLMQNVMAFGTASVVRGLGFTAPAAGKTGTSHDAWFAGYSSNLLCIIWVGNDDYTNVNLQGADAAAPIWAAFMNRAIRIPQYSDMKSFSAPSGVQVLTVDRASGLIADESCPSDSFTAGFLNGTAPNGSCSHMGENPETLGSRLFGLFGGQHNNPPPSQTHP